MCKTYEMYLNVKSTFKHCDKWESIIMQWIENNKQYLEANGFKDSAYWHNEMANISCLVGAIWKIGGVAISEYTATKGNGKKDYNRADIYFLIDDIKYLVESKYIRENGATTIFEKNIESEMEKAVEECKNIKDGYVHNRMALVFVVPTDKTQININDFDCDIRVMLKINGNRNLEYDGKNYNTVYLFGKYVNTIK